MHCSRANRVRHCATSSFAVEMNAPALVSWITSTYVYPSRMPGAARQPVARAAVCALLREGAPPAVSVPADVLAAARADDVHLLLATDSDSHRRSDRLSLRGRSSGRE